MPSSPTRGRVESRRSIAKAGPGEGPFSQRGFQALGLTLSHFVGEGEHLCCRNYIT